MKRSTGLSPIIKYTGGKEKELPYIIPNLPEFDRYFEPFVGGGSVFMSVEANEYYINDFSWELTDLYKCIKTSDNQFFTYVGDIIKSWGLVKQLFLTSKKYLVDGIYSIFWKGVIRESRVKDMIDTYCEDYKDIIDCVCPDSFKKTNWTFIQELKTNLFRKMKRMKKLDENNTELDLIMADDNIQTAIHSALYMTYRTLYNDEKLTKQDRTLHCALYFFIRNYAYSGMFRYNDNGEFNVPYGGMGYNKKSLSSKTDYYKSDDVMEHFNKTSIFNLDFEEFLKKCNPTENDFIFLDPPYDSTFSTYAQNEFTKDDQIRLANYLINECKAKWMVDIKYTDFIYDLYNKPGIRIVTFDKKYQVNFMGRNDTNVTHIMIMNY